MGNPRLIADRHEDVEDQAGGPSWAVTGWHVRGACSENQVTTDLKLHDTDRKQRSSNRHPADDLGLVKIGDPSMLILDDDSGQHLVPGEMMQADVLELQVVDLGGWAPSATGVRLEMVSRA